MPNRASLDSRRGRPDTAGRRDRLVAAAVEIADREGIAAVSIRRIAAELAMRPMSVYTYLTSKDELLDLMAEAVVAEVLVTQPLPDDWRAALEAIALHSHHAFVAHPWLAAVSQQRPHLGLNGLRHAEQMLTAIAPLGLPAAQAWQVLYLINDYTLGHAQRIAHAPPPTAGTYPAFDPEQYPHLAATLADAPRRNQDTFRAGLQRILNGIERSATPP